MTDPHDSADELAAGFEQLARASVLVLGDATLERRVYGQRDALAGGAFHLGLEEASPGGAAALVSRLASFGVATALVSVLGDDLAGAELTALVGAQAGVEPWLLVDSVKATVTETNYVDAEGHVHFRTVREDVRPMATKLRERMLRIAGDAMAATAVTVLSDRGHGTLDVEAAMAIVSRARQAARRIVADIECLQGLESRYHGFDVLVHMPEATAAGAPDRGAEARALREAAEVGAAVLFLREGGYVVADREGAVHVPGEPAALPDATYPTFVAGLAGAMAVGRSVRKAAQIGAYATRREEPPGTMR